MKLMAISSRTAKEILRDPLNLFFGLGFPVILLLLLSAIQANVPVELFALNRLTPGIAVFGLSFMTLFAATVYNTVEGFGLYFRVCLTIAAHGTGANRDLLWYGPAVGAEAILGDTVCRGGDGASGDVLYCPGASLRQCMHFQAGGGPLRRPAYKPDGLALRGLV